MSLTVKVEGGQELVAKLKAAGEEAMQKAGQALFLEAEEIMSISKQQYVPVEHGTLRASGHVLPPKIEGDSITVQLGYGGAASAYAIAVHEHLSEHSPRSWRRAEQAGRPVRFSLGGPKYLERPLMEVAKHLASRLALRLKNAGLFQ